MKQKKIGTTLYVFSETAYQITEDTDAAVIKIQLECIPAYEALNASIKDKFEPINYKLYCVKHPEWADYYDDYTVSVSVTGNGAVSASPTSADEGEEITLTVTPESGYEINTLTAASGGTAITITDNKFLMPAGNVTVTATFQGQAFDITCAAATNGTVTAPASARLGDTVTITTTPDAGYKLDTLTAMCGDVPVTITNSAFTMPAGDVTITATFVLDVIPFDEQYFTIESEADNNSITLQLPGSLNAFSYSLDDGETWTEATLDSIYSYTASLDEGDKILVKSVNDKYGTNATTGLFVGTAAYKVYGNIMSLLYGDDFIGVQTLKANGSFEGLFYNETHLTDASDLIMPVQTLNYTSCYKNMFNGCTSLTGAPVLPATTLTDNCYQGMFQGCTSLVNAPTLPATTLAYYCYLNMFYGCTSLTTAPTLNATTVPDSAYSGMFNQCTNLTAAPKLLAQNVGNAAYKSMFSGTNIEELVMLGINMPDSGGAEPYTNMLANINTTGVLYVNPNMNSYEREWVEEGAPLPSGWTIADYVPES